MSGGCVIWWMRRDLRLQDNHALAVAAQTGLPVQPVFIFDTDVLAQFPNPQDRRVRFIARALEEIRRHTGNVLLLHGSAKQLMPRLAKALEAKKIIAVRDVEPSAIARDAHVASQHPLMTVDDQWIMAPDALSRENGEPYKVFTPFFRAWLARLEHSPLSVAAADAPAWRTPKLEDSIASAQAAGLNVLQGNAAQMLTQIAYSDAPDLQWDVRAGQARLQQFINEKLAQYAAQRDFPAVDGTSMLSPYLRFGLISIRQLLRSAQAHGAGAKWISELAWRDFYAMILYRFPESVTKEWNPAYRGTLEWSDNEAHFQAWANGNTGYPLVDAAQRQLLETGWMHNRLRMVSASFLTKDLRIDWRRGEAHFAQYLMDYELASNVGGWQWAASTGTDAQPWFRIFNPTLQSQKFDAAGAFIRRFCPELAGLPDEAIHAPNPLERPAEYPAPIVDHAQAREATLAMFKRATKMSS